MYVKKKQTNKRTNKQTNERKNEMDNRGHKLDRLAVKAFEEHDLEDVDFLLVLMTKNYPRWVRLSRKFFRCECCPRHQQNRPNLVDIMPDWVIPDGDKIPKKDIMADNVCQCSCRHWLRLGCIALDIINRRGFVIEQLGEQPQEQPGEQE